VLIAAVAAAFVLLPAGTATACDPLDPSACLYLWPNAQFTRADLSSPTGKRLALRDEWMPRNREGKPVSAARQKSEFLRTDGAVIDVCGGAPCVP
jgi:hypothetical protein